MGQNPIVDEAKRQMDENIAGVMPGSWLGHARLTISRADLSETQQKAAEKLAVRLMSKDKYEDAERVAEAAIRQARKKF